MSRWKSCLTKDYIVGQMKKIVVKHPPPHSLFKGESEIVLVQALLLRPHLVLPPEQTVFEDLNLTPRIAIQSRILHR